MKISTVMWVVLILLLGLVLRFRGLHHDVDGVHLFRQTHVASNIFYLVQDGFTLKTEKFSKNRLMKPVPESYKIFDGALYQNIVAVVSRTTGLDIILAARLVNLALCF